MKVSEQNIDHLDLPPVSLHTETFIGTAIFALLLGIGFVFAGIKGRQWWIVFWGSTLILASIAYLIAVALGFR